MRCTIVPRRIIGIFSLRGTSFFRIFDVSNQDLVYSLLLYVLSSHIRQVNCNRMPNKRGTAELSFFKIFF